MSGYSGYSMSNNAVDAYNSDEMPLSKWTKVKFLEIVKETYPDKLIICEQLTLPAIKQYALTKSSWHHTSEYFNKTDFYVVDEDFINDLTQDKVKELNQFAKVPKKDSEIFLGNVTWIEWAGTRNYPKKIIHSLKNIPITKKGSFYIFKDEYGFEVRKKIGSNGTEVEKLDSIDKDILTYDLNNKNQVNDKQTTKQKLKAKLMPQKKNSKIKTLTRY